MVLGPDKGATTARQRGLDALFLLRDDDKGTREVAVGRLFSDESAAIVVTEGA
jgi:thiamine biosynthesis lipoprotein